MTSPTDITKEVVLADLKAHGPSLVKDVTRRLLGLSPKAAKNLARTHTEHFDRVNVVLQSLVALGVVAIELSEARRTKGQRQGKYEVTDHHKTDTNAAIPEQMSAGGSSVVVSGGGVFATRQDGVVFRYAPVSGDPNGEWQWQRLPDLPQD